MGLLFGGCNSGGGGGLDLIYNNSRLSTTITSPFTSSATVISLDSVDGLEVGYELVIGLDIYNVSRIKRTITAVDSENKTVTIDNPITTPSSFRRTGVDVLYSPMYDNNSTLLLPRNGFTRMTAKMVSGFVSVLYGNITSVFCYSEVDYYFDAENGDKDYYRIDTGGWNAGVNGKALGHILYPGNSGAYFWLEFDNDTGLITLTTDTVPSNLIPFISNIQITGS